MFSSSSICNGCENCFTFFIYINILHPSDFVSRLCSRLVWYVWRQRETESDKTRHDISCGLVFLCEQHLYIDQSIIRKDVNEHET